ncbi:hypothetical protein [Paraburkholderia aromaticivorans]|uniref:hypothetical protein n=1 Tax=Paraburkholderia aromaticivorans TaxID=2026199 RepID=UPI0014561F83|nr:hypothetical protein [Paraburkholderia aromaticivorans]
MKQTIIEFDRATALSCESIGGALAHRRFPLLCAALMSCLLPGVCMTMKLKLAGYEADCCFFSCFLTGSTT